MENNEELDNADFHGINKFKLDEEWEKQPYVFKHWADKLALAKSDLRYAESQLELVDSELYLEIKRDPGAYNLPKETVEVIKAAVIIHQRHQDAEAELLKLKHKVDLLQNAVTAIDCKKYGLQDMVKLFGLDYYSMPVATGTKKEVFNDIEKRSTRTKVKIRQRGE